MRARLAMLVLAAIALAGCGPIGVDPPAPPVVDPAPAPPAPGGGAAPVITVTMTGPPEVPPGDPDGTGTAAITLDAAQSQVCVDFTVAGIDPATAAHIHDGAAGIAGPVVVDLPVPESGAATGCVPTDPALVQVIVDDPARFYVNVHNLTYPKGALRAQLGAGAAATAAAHSITTGGEALHCRLPRLV